MYCVDCGKEKQIFREGSCKECYLKQHSFSQAPVYIDIPICAHCGSLKYKSNWTTDSFQEILQRYARQQLHLSDELSEVTISFVYDTILDVFPLEIIINATLDGAPIQEKHTVTVRMRKNVCEVCSKMFGGYHEAIIQIRPYKKKLSKNTLEKLQDFIESHIYTIQQQGNRTLFISDMGEEHGGLDYFLSDKQSAYTIVKKTQEMFGGEITTSSKNVGMKDGKQLYKMTYLLRLYPFQSGDLISLKGTFFFVQRFSQTKIRLIHLQTWEEITKDIKELDHAIVHGGEELITWMILISQTETEVQVMHKETFTIQVLKKPKKMMFQTETVPVVELHQQRFIVPLFNDLQSSDETQ